MSAFDTISRSGLLAREVLGAELPEERLRRVRGQPLQIALDPALATTRRGQSMLALVAQLCGRLFDFVGTIDLAVPHVLARSDVPGLRAGARLDRTLASMVRSFGSGAPRVRSGLDDARPAHVDEAHYERAIAIGAGAPARAEQVVWIDGAGWRAVVGSEPPPTAALREPEGAPFNPFGPLVAASWGTGELAKTLFRSLAREGEADRFPRIEGTRSWNTWSHTFDDDTQTGPPLPDSLELGEVGAAGVGALGSAAVYALAELEPATARGLVELCDDDTLSPTNLERVLTARARDLGRPKVDLARRMLRRSGLRTRVLRGRYGPGGEPRGRVRSLLVGVDSGAARRAIAEMQPERVYNGGTQGSEILVSRHVAGQGPCLECLYPEVQDPAGRVARQLGVSRDVADALARGERRVDDEIIAAMRRRGGIELDGIEVADLRDAPLDTLEGYVCSRAVVIEDLPEATISFVAALCGVLMACEWVKDRVRPDAERELSIRLPALRLDLLADVPGPHCVEAFVARRSCPCQQRVRIAPVAPLAP